MTGAPALEVADLHVHLGESHVLQGVSFAVEKGGVTALLGRNGVGKTTTLRALLGLVPRSLGTVQIDGENATRLPTHAIVQRGVGYVPEDRAIFPDLTVREFLPPGIPFPAEASAALLRDTDGNGVADLRSVLLAGLNSPFGMALVGNDLYVANSDAVLRFPYVSGDTRIIGSSGNSIRNWAEIWVGDHSSSTSHVSTWARSRSQAANLAGLGRRARSHARR